MRVVCVGFFAAISLWAATPNPVHWSAGPASGKPLHAGTKLTVKLHAQIDSGWHLYATQQDEGGPVALEISLPEDSGLTLGSVRASKPLKVFDPNFGKRVQLYVDHADFALPITVSSSAYGGERSLPIRVRYQCCNDTMCLPPRTATVNASVAIKSGH